MRINEATLVWLGDTGDTTVATEVRRIAAAAECPIEEVHAGDTHPPGHTADVPSQVRRRWLSAPAVILDPQSASACASSSLPRRDGIILVHSGAGDDPSDQWREFIGLGISDVCALPGDEAQLITMLAERLTSGIAAGRVIAVAGACGGAGATVLSAALTLVHSVAQPRRSLLVDTDSEGPGIDLILGLESAEGLRWPDLTNLTGRVSAEALWSALPAVDGIAVLAHSRDARTGPHRKSADAGVLRAVVESTRSAGALCVVDVAALPSMEGELLCEIADLVVLVVPAQLRACASARVRSVHLRDRRCGLVVRGPAPGGLTGRDVARAVGLDLIATMRPEAGLDARLERGGLTLPRSSPLRSAALRIMDAAEVVAA
ncbi:septum site-determining protein Ssd [Hoyosella altamirensis]|uniref:Secretion/DNA translocation related CpaE-like protein n=1 Tax=Hoyosella altamirensis TaxID=616997 RepID=A0A839RPI8_9ACTN|nr:septum site-determining protein Ssd [Hoyosella altamirensis]MBB3037821.1 secretion/DNA translocation related CpaE-like protein [Hoyosella altamirensis]